MKRKALGKGLRSLIPAAPPRAVPTEATGGEGIQQIDLDRIRPNPSQPRQRFEAETMEELAASLKRDGVLQPVIVRARPGGEYELVAGERRWRAAQQAGLLKIPAIVRDVQDERLLELALIENLQREELNPLESAWAYQTLIDDLGHTQQQVADRVGKQRATIANALRLLNLPLEVQDQIRSGLLSAGHAKAIASLPNAKAQVELAARIVRDALSVRQVESIVARPARQSSKPAPAPQRDPNVVAAEEALQRELSTRVRIVQGRHGGRIEVFFHDDEELQRVYELLLPGK